MKYNVSFKKNTNRFSEQDLLENIKKVWDFLGRQPYCNDMENEPSCIGFATYFNRFGSWKKALEKFALYVKGDYKSLEETKYKKCNRKINNSLRYEIMKRDNFKCCLCGNSPAMDSKCVLVIDHIKPIAKGGNNNIENLQTLCKVCNSGKYDKF